MAAITPLPKAQRSTSATSSRSSYLEIPHGRHRIWISSTDWSGSKSVKAKYTPLRDDDHLGTLKQADFSTDIEFTENGGADVHGPGFVCIDITSGNSADVNLFLALTELTP